MTLEHPFPEYTYLDCSETSSQGLEGDECTPWSVVTATNRTRRGQVGQQTQHVTADRKRRRARGFASLILSCHRVLSIALDSGS